MRVRVDTHKYRYDHICIKLLFTISWGSSKIGLTWAQHFGCVCTRFSCSKLLWTWAPFSMIVVGALGISSCARQLYKDFCSPHCSPPGGDEAPVTSCNSCPSHQQFGFVAIREWWQLSYQHLDIQSARLGPKPKWPAIECRRTRNPKHQIRASGIPQIPMSNGAPACPPKP